MRNSAGGIRTHGLELMRLARTAAPLPRCKRLAAAKPPPPLMSASTSDALSGRQESNLRSPVPKTGGVAKLPHDQLQTPGGTRTRPSELRAQRHRPSTTGAGKLRRQGSNLRLTVNSRASCRSTTPERNGGSRIRTCGRAPRAYALATRRLQPLGHASRAEGEGVEPPRPRSPPVFETGYRARWQPFQHDSGRIRTCTTPIKSRRLYPLSYRVEV
jgi:hypothetical protein